MTRKEGTFLRARRPEQKQLRYATILDAARELAEREGVGAVSLTGIAAQVGMHKSALLKYFETREEIFLRLAQAEWRAWADGVVAALPTAGPVPHDVADALARSVADRPLFCQLLLHSPLTLEHNVSIEVVRAFKDAVNAVLQEVQPALQQALPALDADACLDLLMVVGFTASGLWQVAHPSPQVLALKAADPSAVHHPEFGQTLARYIRTYLAGLLAVEGDGLVPDCPTA